MDKTYQTKLSEGLSYDVIVCGGGTAGCAAAIAAARSGARTLMIERSFTCGGMLTQGNAGITKFTEHYSDQEEYRDRVLRRLRTDPLSVQVAGGIPKEYVERMMAAGYAVGTDGQPGSYVFTDRYGSQFTLMEMLREAGVEVLYGTAVCDVTRRDDVITGVIVWNKAGFTLYPARRVIDATGDADVAALSGAPVFVGASKEDIDEGGATELGQMNTAGCMYRVSGVDTGKLLEHLKNNPGDFEVHNFGKMMLDDVLESAEKNDMYVFRFLVRKPDGSLSPVQFYNAPAKDDAVLLSFGAGANVNGLDPADTSRGQTELFLGVRDAFAQIRRTVPGFENARLSFIPDIGIRETRRVIGDYVINARDVLLGTRFEDSIGCGGHPVDCGNIKKEIAERTYEDWRFYIPYRILLPRGVENLLVAGRCVSATRIAFGCLRPTVQCMVMGEAAGTAAALSIGEGVTCRALEYEKLKQKLLADGAVL